MIHGSSASLVGIICAERVTNETRFDEGLLIVVNLIGNHDP